MGRGIPYRKSSFWYCFLVYVLTWCYMCRTSTIRTHLPARSRRISTRSAFPLRIGIRFSGSRATRSFISTSNRTLTKLPRTSPSCSLVCKLKGASPYILTTGLNADHEIPFGSTQGSYHTVVRWIHRASFQLRGETPLLPQRSTATGRTPLIDVGWEGTVFIEAEGTNEGLDELQARCGPEVRIVVRSGQFAPPAPPPKSAARHRGKTVFRMIRSQSRPGELWLRCAREKEKVLS